MGYELNKLKQQYGLSTASKAQYAGTTDADKAAYDAYSAQYDQRLQNTPMYANKQFQTVPQQQAENIDELYQLYLGRPRDAASGEGTTMYAGEGVPDWVNTPEPGGYYTQVMTPITNPITGEVYVGTSGGYSLNRDALAPMSDAQRKAFIRGGEQEYANLGINNTGNQAIMNLTGNYYGNTLMNPQYGSGSTGTGTTDSSGNATTGYDPNTGQYTYVDADGNTQTVNLSNINISGSGFGNINMGNVPGTGYQFDDDGNIIWNVETTDNIVTTETGEDNTEGSGTIDVTDINMANATSSNDDDPTDPFEQHKEILEQAANSPYGDNSLTESLANFFTPFDGASYVDGTLTYDEDVFTPGSEAVPDDDDNYSGSMNSSYNDEDSEGGGWSWSESNWNPSNWFQEGGEVRGYAEGDPVIVDEETIETITDVPDLDELALANINNIQDSNTNIAALQRMLASSALPSSSAVSDARSALDTARTEFSDLLKRSADTAGQGPSESEKWFRLAAAFGKPTQSGHFMENLGLANEAMAGYKADQRAAKTAADALLMQGAEFNLDYLKDDLASATAASAAERDWKRGLAADLLAYERDQKDLLQQREFDLAVLAGEREYEAGKPKSEAAKIADDMGLVGAEREAYIKKFYEDKNAIAALEIEALNKQVNALSSGELNLKIETEDVINSGQDTLAKIDRALELNDLAYAGNVWDRAKGAIIGTFDPENEAMVATRELENVLSAQALSQLKATFGGAGITDSERRALDALQGANALSKTERARILRAAADAISTVVARMNTRLTDINAGTYGQKTRSE